MVFCIENAPIKSSELLPYAKAGQHRIHANKINSIRIAANDNCERKRSSTIPFRYIDAKQYIFLLTRSHRTGKKGAFSSQQSENSAQNHAAP